MRIIETKNNTVIVEDGEKGLLVRNKNLEQEWKVTGIAIPHLKKMEFDNQTVVKLGDKNFRKALIEVYYPLNMNKTLFRLED